MTAPFRCFIAVGLSVLVLTGTLSPVSASAAPAPTPPPTASSPATSTSPQPPRPSSSTSYHRDDEDYSLTVSPTRLTVGQRNLGDTQKVTVINRGRQPLGITVQKRNFSANIDGSLTYEEDAPYAASAWVTVSPTKLTLAPGQAQVVTATIAAPSGHEPGDHQMALVFLVPSGHSEGNVLVNRGIGLPVYITAPGPIDKSVDLSDLRAASFVRRGPVDITATVHNNGTVHEDFRAPSPLTVQAPGKPAAFPDFTVPRNAVRNIATTWDPPLLCVCHPTVTLTGPDGVTQSDSIRVIVFPWDLFAGLVGAGLLIALAVRLLRRRYQASVARAAAALHHADGSDDG